MIQCYKRKSSEARNNANSLPFSPPPPPPPPRSRQTNVNMIQYYLSVT
ncbi:MAG: hypothetical protein IPI30_15970 [Saprospiraceae bacterium]|nr:hypothetical protein [Candidatus Vicinibacter affinis]